MQDEHEVTTLEPSVDSDTQTEQQETQGDVSTGEQENWEEKAKQLEEQNKKLFARVQRAEKALKPEPSPEPQTNEPTKGSDTYNKQEVSFLLKGGTEEQLSFINAVAKGMGVGFQQAADMPHVKASIEAMRSKEREQDATPAPSKRAVQAITPQNVKDAVKNSKVPFAEWQAQKRKAGKSSA